MEKLRKATMPLIAASFVAFFVVLLVTESDPVCFPLALFPILLTAVLLGIKGGVASSLIAMALVSLMITREQGLPWPSRYIPHLIMGFLVYMLSGLFAGLWSTTERRRREEERKRQEVAQTLREVSAVLSSTLELKEVLDLILEQLGEVVDYDSACVMLLFDDAPSELSPSGRSFKVVAGHGFPDLERTLQLSFPLEKDVLGQEIFKTKQPLVLADAQQDERYLKAGGTDWVRAWMGIPLMVKGEVIGLLTIDNKQPKVYNEETAQIALAFANQAAIAIENARLYEQARQEIAERKRMEDELLHRAERLAAVNLISAAASSTLDLNEILNTIAQQMVELFAVEHCGILIFDQKKEWGYVLAEYPDRGATAERFEVKGYLAAERIIADQKPLMIEDVLEDPLMARVRDTMRRLGIKSMLIVPLVVKGETIGSIGLDVAKERRTFSREEIELAQAIANQVAMAIENARLYEEATGRVRELSALTEVGEAINRALSLEETLNIVLREAMALVGREEGSIILLDRRTNTLRIVASQGLPPKVVEAFNARPVYAHEGTFGIVIETGEMLEISDARSDPRVLHEVGRVPEQLINVPLRTEEGVIGVIALDALPPDDRSRRLLRALGDLAAVAIQRARLYEAEQRRRQDAEALRQTALALTSALDRNQVIDRILAQLQQVVPYDSASVQLLEGDRLVIIGGRGFPNLEEILGTSFPVDGDNPNREVMRTLSPFILEDAPAVYEAFTQEPFAAMGIRSWLGVPMLVGGRPVGMITLDKCQPGFYTEEHAKLAQAFAAQAAIAIENARLFEEEKRRVAQLRTISEVGRHIASILDLDELLHRVVNLLVEVFGYYYANVLMVDEEAQEIVLTASAGETGRAFEGLRLKIGEQGITGWVAGSGEPLLVNDVDKEPRYYFVEELADTKSELAVPIKLRGKVIGVLDVQSVELDAFDEVDLSTLTTLADQLAVAIENARLYQETERLAITDGLTGLYNRRHFYEMLDREVELVRRYDGHISLIMFDIDDFKVYNDTYGHLVGDALLRELAQLLRRDIRKMDFAARYGGDEFVILLPHTDKKQVLVLAERIRTSVEEYEFCSGEGLPAGKVTVSVGVATCPEDAVEPEDLVHAADMALFEAKKRGNKVCVCGE